MAFIGQLSETLKVPEKCLLEMKLFHSVMFLRKFLIYMYLDCSTIFQYLI